MWKAAGPGTSGWYGAPVALTDSLEARVDRLELPFNEYGVDPYGISKSHVKHALRVFGAIYRYYFRVRCYGVEHIPPRAAECWWATTPAAWRWTGPWS